MRWKEVPPDIDWSAAAEVERPRSIRARLLTAAGVVVLGLVVAAPVVAFDRLHPRDRIVSRGRIWHCALVGGSWPVDAGLEVGLRPGARMVRFGAVTADGVW